LPKDSTQKFKCFLSTEKVLLFKVMYRVGFQGARTCQFFDVQISIKLCKLKNCALIKKLQKNSYPGQFLTIASQNV